MHKLALGLLVLCSIVAIARAGVSPDPAAEYLPLTAAPEYHKAVLENEFVLVLDVSIPAGASVPAHVHPWPAVFITLQGAHLIFRSLAGEVVRETVPQSAPLAEPRVEWREADVQPASVTNVGDGAMRALRIELKFL